MAQRVQRARDDTSDYHVSAPALAKIVGVTERRLRQLLTEGLPRSGRGQYPLCACVQWFVRYKQSLSIKRVGRCNVEILEEKRSLLRSRNAHLELQLGKIRKSLIDRRQCIAAVDKQLTRLNRKLELLPATLSRELGWSYEEELQAGEVMASLQQTYFIDAAQFLAGL